MLLMMDPEEYDFLIAMLEQRTRTPEEMPKMHALMNMESPFAKEDECTQ